MPRGPKKDPQEAARLAEARAKEGAQAYAGEAKPQAPAPVTFTPEQIREALYQEEYGLSRLAVKSLAGRFIYDVEHQQAWEFKHDGGHYALDKSSNAKMWLRELLAAELLREARRLGKIVAEAPTKEERDEAEKLQKMCFKAMNRLNRRTDLNSIFAFACQGDGSLAISSNVFDQDPWALHALNGKIDLRTGQLLPGHPEDYGTKVCPAEWKGLHEPAPAWEAFLQASLEGRQEIIDYLQRAMGAAIVGQHQRTFHVLYGKHGSNGKTVFAETAGELLGDYGYPMPSAVFMTSPKGGGNLGPAPEISELKGRRFAWASETEKGGRLNTERLKWLTGGDTINARGLFSAPEKFRPTHSIFLLTNHLPRIGADEEAFWTRFRLIEFKLSFVENPTKEYERPWDPQLKDKLLAERSGILAWMVRGCLAWQKDGCSLTPPEEVATAVAEYRMDEDAVEMFIEACCETGQEYQENAKPLHEKFVAWHKEEFGENVQPLGPKKFWESIGGKFQRERQGTKKTVVFKGVRLKW